ncbi:MAG: YgfZ/GcvT domain-containing protein [Chthoniobacterales bacterium]
MSDNSEPDALSKIRNEGGFFRLPPRLIIKVTGNDRLRYLNGQVTADLKKLTPDEAIQACLLTPKGKLSALLWITATHEALLLESEPELSDALMERLSRYIIADDVTLKIIEATPKIHFFGPILEHPIAQGIIGTKIHRFGLSGKDVALSELETLAGLSSVQPLTEETVEAFRIAQGIPRWGYELTEETLPPEANLDKSCIDYEKGCYVGQEVISRLKSRGHVNRLLLGFVGIGEIPLTRGMELFSQDDQPQQIGILTSATKKIEGNPFIALGYLKRGYDIIGAQLTAIDPATEVATHVTVTSFPI